MTERSTFCEKCSLELGSVSARTEHFKKVHQGAVQCKDVRGDMVWHVRADGGHFECKKECGFSTPIPERLRRHFLKCGFVLGEEAIGLPKDAARREPLGDEIERE